MTLPGDRIPEEARTGSSASTPAADADVHPLFCRHSVRWCWDPGEGAYRCDRAEHYDGPLPTIPGALPGECLPPYAHPPRDNPQLQAVIDGQDRAAQAAAIIAHADELARGILRG